MTARNARSVGNASNPGNASNAGTASSDPHAHRVPHADVLRGWARGLVPEATFSGILLPPPSAEGANP
jgi:hypothetical protein